MGEVKLGTIYRKFSLIIVVEYTFHTFQTIEDTVFLNHQNIDDVVKLEPLNHWGCFTTVPVNMFNKTPCQTCNKLLRIFNNTELIITLSVHKTRKYISHCERAQ